jgi:hypothetical protein
MVTESGHHHKKTLNHGCAPAIDKLLANNFL